MVSLEDLISVKHGFAFKGESIHDDPRGDVLLTPGNFAIGGGFKRGKFKYYDGPVPEEYVLRAGDLLVTMTDLSKEGDTLGYPAFVPAPTSGRRYLHNQRLGRVLIKAPSALDKTFLHYLLCSREYRDEVLASATGTSIKHTSPERICRFCFRRPPLTEQRAIAQILCTLDDKIALNRRKNETLEGMASAIFKDWFVEFGPTRAKAEGLAPYLAPQIWVLFPDRLDDEDKPEGWKDGCLGDVARTVGESVKPNEMSSDTPYIGLEHMPRHSIALNGWGAAGKVTSGKLAFHRGDFLFGKLRPYFHKVGIAPLDGICSTDILALGPKTPNAAAFVLSCISSDEFVAYTDQTSGGTKMPRTSWEVMTRYPLCLPTEQVTQAFQHAIGPMLDRIILNIHESTSLAKTRDLLLPKLMAGEIRLRESGKSMEAVA